MDTHIRILDWQPLASIAGHFHIGRTVFTRTSFRQPHTHRGFAEVFWVEEGPGRHWINGQVRRLDVGDLVLVREKDTHDFAGSRAHRLCIINVAFSVMHLTELRRRYFAQAPWLWEGSQLPTRLRRQSDCLKDFSRWAMGVTQAQKTVRELHWFLLTLLRVDEQPMVTYSPGTVGQVAKLPDWLAAALHQCQQATMLARGVAGLAEITRRSPEHISRLMREHLGMTTSEFIQRRRMEYLAQQLRMTERPLAAIAADVGLHHTGYIHRSFKQHMGLSPRRYRIREQTLLH